MRYSEAVQRNLNELTNLHQDLARSANDDERRKLTKMVVEQCVFDFPNENYVWKSQTPAHPPSKDNLGQLATKEGFIGWDLYNGTTREANQFPDSFSLETQHPIILVGVDHLNHGAKPPVDKPDGEEPQGDASLNDIEVLLMDIIALLQLQNRTFLQLGENLQVAVKKLVDEGIPVRFGR